MTQVSAFQIKAVTLEVSKHLLNPHATTISSKRLLYGGEIGSQEPRMLFARMPVGQEVDGKGKTLRKVNIEQPRRLTRLLHQSITALPQRRLSSREVDASFLAQDIIPTPL